MSTFLDSLQVTADADVLGSLQVTADADVLGSCCVRLL